MKRFNDPFPATPEGFHLRVEETLMSLEEKPVDKRHVFHKTALLAAVIALLLTAVAGVVGHTRLKDALNAAEVAEVAALVEEVHATGDSPVSGKGLSFSVDELIWEGNALYVTCSLAVPEDGDYLVALYNPLLNGQRLEYNALGWTQSKFFDQPENRVLLLGNTHGTQCTELLTFKVDSALREQHDNHLQFRAALMKTAHAFQGETDFGGLFNGAEYASLNPDADWLFEQGETDYTRMLHDIQSARGTDDVLTIDELCRTQYAAMADVREIDLNLDAARTAPILFDDVANRDFEMDGLRLHVEDFRLTHTGISMRYTVTDPEGDSARLNAYMESCAQLSFCTPTGKPLGLTLDESGSASMTRLSDGSPAIDAHLEISAFIPLKDSGAILLAPVSYPEDAQGRQLPPVYDMERAVTLTPVQAAG